MPFAKDIDLVFTITWQGSRYKIDSCGLPQVKSYSMQFSTSDRVC